MLRACKHTHTHTDATMEPDTKESIWCMLGLRGVGCKGCPTKPKRIAAHDVKPSRRHHTRQKNGYLSCPLSEATGNT